MNTTCRRKICQTAGLNRRSRPVNRGCSSHHRYHASQYDMYPYLSSLANRRKKEAIGAYSNATHFQWRISVYIFRQKLNVRCSNYGSYRLTSVRLNSGSSARQNNTGYEQDEKQSTTARIQNKCKDADIRPDNNSEYYTGADPRPAAKDDSSPDDLMTSIASQMRSIPNVITTSRIASTPFISCLILSEQYHYAVAGCVVFGLTDILDGYIARNYAGQNTVLGTYLDPLADKIMVNVLAASLWYNALLPGPIVGIWLARDVGLIATSLAAVSKATKSGDSVVNPATTPLKVQPTKISKVNTILQFLTISGGMAQPLFGLSPDIVMGMCWVTGGTTILSGLGYIDGRSMIASGNKPR